MVNAMKEEAGTSLRPFKLRGLENIFPERVYLLYDAGAEAYATVLVRQPQGQRPLSGVACFTSRDFALDYGFDKPGRFVVIEASFDDAHDIARNETPLRDALVLADDTRKLKLHYVR